MSSVLKTKTWSSKLVRFLSFNSQSNCDCCGATDNNQKLNFLVFKRLPEVVVIKVANQKKTLSVVI